MSDILIVYYSRTGKTRMVAEKLAGLLDADTAEIREAKDRSGVLGFVGAGKDTMLKRAVELVAAPDPGGHRVVVLGMPVWAYQPPAPVRTYIGQVDLSGKALAAFCTSDASSGKGTFKALDELLPNPLSATFECVKPKADDAELQQRLADFAQHIRQL